MKKTLATLGLALISFILASQTNCNNSFYKTPEDYLAGKPITGVTLTKWKDYSSTVEYTDNGTAQKEKVSKLQYNWFCNEGGILMRIYDGDLYYAVEIGPLCFYIKASMGTIRFGGKDNYSISGKFSDSWPDEYYSLTPTGHIEKFKEKILEEYLEKNNLKSEYDSDPDFKRQAKDCVLCWQSKKTNKMIKYTKLLNKKLK